MWLDWLGGRVGSLFAARAAPEDSGPIGSSRLYYTGRTQAGVHVTPDTALQQATVWACVTYLSRTVGQLPWHVMAPRANGRGSDRQMAHPCDWLLNVRPCPDYGSFAWRGSMLGTALLWGNAYAEIQRDLRGVPVALWPIHPTRVVVKRAADGGLLYNVRNSGSNTVDLEPFEVFHLRGFGDGPVGLSVVEYAAQSIGWAQATELFGAGYFGEGMNPSGIVEVPAGLSVPALQELKRQFTALYKGPKGERTAFLDAGLKWQKVTSTPDESQFIETRQHQIEEICRWFGVPPHKVQHLLRATFSNIEHQAIEVVSDTVLPWVISFEEEADYKLFGANRQGLFTKMNLNGLLRGDSAARSQFYREMWNIGVLSINDIRDKEDMNPIQGEGGEARFVPANMMTLERALKDPPPAPAPAPGTSGPWQSSAKDQLSVQLSPWRSWGGFPLWGFLELSDRQASTSKAIILAKQSHQAPLRRHGQAGAGQEPGSASGPPRVEELA